MMFLDAVAHDMHLADDIVSVDEYKAVIERSIVWVYEWGVILADGQNMHIHVLSTFRKHVFLRKPLREVAEFMFDRYEIIYTQILKKPEVLEFDLRIGWKLVKPQPQCNLLYYLEMKKEDFTYV